MTGPVTQQATQRAIILGSDLFLAALPAEPVQVVHACFSLGFDLVVPASWGDELIADRVLDEISHRPPGTCVLCSCPHSRRRLLSPGSELSPFLLNLVSPPVAAARYLRTQNAGSALHTTYVGVCPGAEDDSIDERLAPADFLELCARRGILLTDQPRVFESRIPTDRRRYRSLPGGLPTLDSVRSTRSSADVVALDAHSLSFDLTQCIISERNALLDPAPAVGCACSGFVGEIAWGDGREALAALEPPRSATPVVDQRVHVDLELPAQPLPTPAFEEPVPLNVVVGADMNGDSDGTVTPPLDDTAQPGEDAFFGESVDYSSFLDKNALATAAEDLELAWSERAFDTEPALDAHAAMGTPGSEPPPEQTARAAAEPITPDRDTVAAESRPAPAPAAPPEHIAASPRPRNGTPTGTPSVRTNSGPLPRAYMMYKRLASGEHRAIIPDVPPAPPPERAQESEAQPEPIKAAAAAPSHKDGHATVQRHGPVESVIDLLSKAIRDVVEH